MPINKFRFYLKNFFSRGHERTIRAKKNIVISFISKAISISVSFLIVPLTLNYVGNVEYGIWMTLSSIIYWFAYFDIGLGNGLRNKLSESIAKNDIETARIYISSSLTIITGIAMLMFTAFYIVAHIIPWNQVFNTELIPNEELLRIVIIVFFLFCIGFIFNITSSVLQSVQRYGINDLINVSSQIVGLVGIYFLVKTTDGSLLNLSIVYAGKTPFVMILASIFLFYGSLRYLLPGLSHINLRKALPLINLGFKFFLNQILYLIVTQSSLVIVAQFFGPKEVTVYNLAVRYMTLATMAYMMILTPFLTAFTEAYTKMEFDWIRKTIKRINNIWIISSLFTIILIFFYKWFFKQWVGDAVEVPLNLVIALAISGIIHTYYNKYSLFLNGIGLIHLQLYLLGLQALLFVPLSYLFYRLNFQLMSLVAAQIILYSFTAFFMHLQYKKIIDQKASGIWAR